MNVPTNNWIPTCSFLNTYFLDLPNSLIILLYRFFFRSKKNFPQLSTLGEEGHSSISWGFDVDEWIEKCSACDLAEGLTVRIDRFLAVKMIRNDVKGQL